MIHKSSVIADGAIIAPDVEIGPLCYIGPNVKIGSKCKLLGHCNIDGYTMIGENNIFHPFVAIGQIAQDYSANSEIKSYLEIGNNNIFREGFTAHLGTTEGSKTQIGNNCMFMNSSHVAHNCKVHNNVILVNGSVIGGHSEIFDNVIISGVSCLHQFCRMGRFSILSGGSAFSKDIPPFMMAEGRNGGVKMINLVGLKRNGFNEDQIKVIKQIFKIYYRSELSPSNAIKALEALEQTPEVIEFINFCSTSQKGVIMAKVNGHRT